MNARQARAEVLRTIYDVLDTIVATTEREVFFPDDEYSEADQDRIDKAIHELRMEFIHRAERLETNERRSRRGKKVSNHA